ncbi:Retinol dehydrogenase 14 [Sarcoptes scabiei]|nr:Retinol dehydrogenase 14 [Sarcoptes scabiei]
MIGYVFTGIAASITTVIIGFRLYRTYFVWGDYHDMIKKYGIGKETARILYQNDARIIMANRNEAQTLEVIDELRKQFPKSNGELVYKRLDLSSMDSVKEFTKDIEKNESRVDVLINNAAVFGAPRQITNDGFEINMQVNHLAQAVLVNRLLPKLSSVDSLGRIVQVSTTLTKTAKLDLEFLSKIDQNQLKNVSDKNIKVYQSSKLANLQFMRALSVKLQSNSKNKIQICLASPGFCYSRLHRYSSNKQMIFYSLLAPFLFAFMKSSRQGAQTIVGCSMIEHIRSTDVLYHNCAIDEEFLKKVPMSASITDETVYEITNKSINEYC